MPTVRFAAMNSSAAQIDCDGTADKGHMKYEARGDQNDRRLNQANGHIRHDLAGHHFDGKNRRGKQIFHRAALAFARDGEAGHHHERHGENDAHAGRERRCTA